VAHAGHDPRDVSRYVVGWQITERESGAGANCPGKAAPRRAPGYFSRVTATAANEAHG
jgi:hypothetical protein